MDCSVPVWGPVMCRCACRNEISPSVEEKLVKYVLVSQEGFCVLGLIRWFKRRTETVTVATGTSVKRDEGRQEKKL